MKILQVINMGYTAGGAEASVRLMRSELQKRGHEIRVLSSDVIGEDMFSDYRFKLISPRSPFKVLEHLFYIRSYRMMRKAIKEFAPDVIHFHVVASCSPSVFYATRTIPSIMTVHGPEEFTVKLLPWFLPPEAYKKNLFDLDDLTIVGRFQYWYHRFIQRPIYRFGLSHIKIFVAPSQYIAHAIENDVSKKNIRQVYNGIDLPAFEPLPKNQRILYVGRLEEVKGVEYLVRGFAEVAHNAPHAELRIVGDGKSRRKLEQLAGDLGIKENVTFRGWIGSREEVMDEYRNASFAVIPSVWPENLPTVCIESLAIGRPVIGTRTGGIPELIEDEKTGYIVPPKDSHALAEKMAKLLLDKETLYSMSKKATESAQRFNATNFIDTIEKLYQEISNGNTDR